MTISIIPLSAAIRSDATDGAGTTRPSQETPRQRIFHQLWMVQGMEEFYFGYTPADCPYTGEGQEYWLIGFLKAKAKAES